MTDHRLLTPDELAAIRDYITGWEPARDRRFLEAARMLLDHADAQDAELARLRDALLDTQRLAWQLEHDGPRYYERKQSPYGEYLKCMYCGEISADAGEFRHTEKCPVRRLYEMKDARALLDGGA